MSENLQRFYYTVIIFHTMLCFYINCRSLAHSKLVVEKPYSVGDFVLYSALILFYSGSGNLFQLSLAADPWSLSTRTVVFVKLAWQLNLL